jgi:hypothetical protein
MITGSGSDSGSDSAFGLHIGDPRTYALTDRRTKNTKEVLSLTAVGRSG